MNKRYYCAVAFGALCAVVGIVAVVSRVLARNDAKKLDDWAELCPDLVE